MAFPDREVIAPVLLSTDFILRGFLRRSRGKAAAGGCGLLVSSVPSGFPNCISRGLLVEWVSLFFAHFRPVPGVAGGARPLSKWFEEGGPLPYISSPRQPLGNKKQDRNTAVPRLRGSSRLFEFRKFSAAHLLVAPHPSVCTNKVVSEKGL